MNKLRSWMHLLRLPQWSKNAVVFAALVFGNPVVDHALLRSIGAFVAFCAVSSAGYIINDKLDIPQDRLHPVKRNRPLASGSISIKAANVAALVLIGFGLVLALLIHPLLLVVVLTYLVLTLSYTHYLKRILFVDVFVIAIGFLLRAVAGAAAVQVPVSVWLMLCTFLLALFLALGKRHSELVRLGDSAARYRSVLAGYSRSSLDTLLTVTAGLTIVAYGGYTFTTDSVSPRGVMLITLPFVVYAILRYLHLVLRRGEGGTPELLLWRDKSLLGSVMAWGISVLLVFAIA